MDTPWSAGLNWQLIERKPQKPADTTAPWELSLTPLFWAYSRSVYRSCASLFTLADSTECLISHTYNIPSLRCTKDRSSATLIVSPALDALIRGISPALEAQPQMYNIPSLRCICTKDRSAPCPSLMTLLHHTLSPTYCGSSPALRFDAYDACFLGRMRPMKLPLKGLAHPARNASHTAHSFTRPFCSPFVTWTQAVLPFPSQVCVNALFVIQDNRTPKVQKWFSLTGLLYYWKYDSRTIDLAETHRQYATKQGCKTKHSKMVARFFYFVLPRRIE